LRQRIQDQGYWYLESSLAGRLNQIAISCHKKQVHPRCNELEHDHVVV
jgi:hypothetical protein